MENIESTYRELILKRDIASSELNDYCKPYRHADGNLPDAIWLCDAECLRLKTAFRLANIAVDKFIKQHRKEVKQIQLNDHKKWKNEKIN